MVRMKSLKNHIPSDLERETWTITKKFGRAASGVELPQNLSWEFVKCKPFEYYNIFNNNMNMMSILEIVSCVSIKCILSNPYICNSEMFLPHIFEWLVFKIRIDI